MKKFLISCLESRVETDGVLYGRYLFGPLPRGQGMTIATALRRSLLSEIAGLAVTDVEIVGVRHEYSIIPGTQESVIDLILNLKKLVFTSTTPLRKKAIGYITVRGPGKILGKDLRLPPGLQCVNPNQFLGTVSAEGFINLKVVISSGRSYLVQNGVHLDSPITDNVAQEPISPRNIFPVDAVFMPVLRANFSIQSDEDVLHFPLHVQSRDVTERVIFEIWTNGTITPREALHEASSELIRFFSMFQVTNQPKRMLKRGVNTLVLKQETEKDGRHTLQRMYEPNQFLNIDVGILPLTPTQLIAFKQRKIHRLADLLDYAYEDLRQIPGITSDSLFTLLCYLRSYGIQLRPEVKSAV